MAVVEGISAGRGLAVLLTSGGRGEGFDRAVACDRCEISYRSIVIYRVMVFAKTPLFEIQYYCSF